MAAAGSAILKTKIENIRLGLLPDDSATEVNQQLIHSGKCLSARDAVHRSETLRTLKPPDCFSRGNKAIPGKAVVQSIFSCRSGEASQLIISFLHEHDGSIRESSLLGAHGRRVVGSQQYLKTGFVSPSIPMLGAKIRLWLNNERRNA